MTLEDLIHFSSDLSQHTGVNNSVRRMGDQVIFKIAGKEFFFHRDGKYLGTGTHHRAKLADLVDAMDTACPDLDDIELD